MSTGSGPTRKSQSMYNQLAMDNFNSWKAQQAELVSKRGENIRDPAAEEAHNKNMMRHCLNAYICHMELDAYAGCLKRNGLWGTKSDEYEVPTKAPLHQVKCAMQLDKYTKCLGSEDNQNTLIGTAILNPNCRAFTKNFHACIDVNISKPVEDAERECTPAYRRMLRCGLNHLWEEYYRSVNNIGDQEDFQTFEMHGDSKKKELFTTLIADTQSRMKEDPHLAGIYDRSNIEKELKD